MATLIACRAPSVRLVTDGESRCAATCHTIMGHVRPIRIGPIIAQRTRVAGREAASMANLPRRPEVATAKRVVFEPRIWHAREVQPHAPSRSRQMTIRQ